MRRALFFSLTHSLWVSWTHSLSVSSDIRRASDFCVLKNFQLSTPDLTQFFSLSQTVCCCCRHTRHNELRGGGRGGCFPFRLFTQSSHSRKKMLQLFFPPFFLFSSLSSFACVWRLFLLVFHRFSRFSFSSTLHFHFHYSFSLSYIFFFSSSLLFSFTLTLLLVGRVLACNGCNVPPSGPLSLACVFSLCPRRQKKNAPIEFRS